MSLCPLLLTFRLLGELVRWRNPQEKLKYDDYCSSEFVGTKNVVVEKEDGEGQLLVLLERSGRFLDGKHALLDKSKEFIGPREFLSGDCVRLVEILILTYRSSERRRIYTISTEG